MKTFRVELACDISAYRTEVIEAIDEADLLKKLRETADDLADCPEFEPDFGCQSGLRALSYREGDDGETTSFSEGESIPLQGRLYWDIGLEMNGLVRSLRERNISRNDFIKKACEIVDQFTAVS